MPYASKLKNLSGTGRFRFGISRDVIKLLALFSMTIDHIGLVWLNDFYIFRIIGRLAFPLFAYMIAESCRYTSNKRRYFLKILLLGLVCQAAYYIAEKSLYQCVLITFSLSILTVYAADKLKNQRDAVSVLLFLAAVCGNVFICCVMPKLLPKTDFYVDYGFCGVMLPLFAAFPKRTENKLLSFFAGILLVSISEGGLQFFSAAALIPLALYNGEQGRYHLKNVFYIYYPLHLAVIYAVSMFI